MINTLLGSKAKMSQAFIEGYRVPVTKVTAGPCVVTQIKKMDKDGYWALQLGLGERKTKNISKALQGHLKKLKSQISNLKTEDSNLKSQTLPRYLREVGLEKEPEVKVGDTIKASDIFKAGDIVTITGTSKSKGFAGPVKRWGFAGGPKTHGQSDRQRSPGSIGATTTPGRVLKGKHMAGRMGGDRVTIKNLHVVSIEPEKNEMLISGPVPGIPGSLLIIKKTASGSLKELEHETTGQQIVEGEAPAGETVSEGAATAPVEPAKQAAPATPERSDGGQGGKQNA
jgi:large subunit ribosomal protein L3